MNVYELVLKRRSIRRFRPIPIPLETLKKIVNAARLAPSAANLQPLKYIIVEDERLRVAVFETLSWAAYIAPAGTPPEGERPMAYIVVLCDKNIDSRYCQIDMGFAVENMILVALSEGIGSCPIASIDRGRLRQILSIPEYLEILLVLALGIPGESPRLEEISDSVRYWRDEEGIHHVPKRPLKDILFINGFK